MTDPYPALQVSQKIRNELRSNEKDLEGLKGQELKMEVKKRIAKRSKGKCHLCGQKLNWNDQSTKIQCDHLEPQAEGGETSFSNLSAAHAGCNLKRNKYGLERSRRLLKMEAALAAGPGGAKFDDAAKALGFEPTKTTVELGPADGEGQELTFHFADKVVPSRVVIQDLKEREFPSVFLGVPISAIYNDADCQPRSLDHKQYMKIYDDLDRNPLNELPTLRIEVEGGGALSLSKPGQFSCRLLMFDGQHKAVAHALQGGKELVARVYVEMSRSRANELVQSLQSRVPKLSLTPNEKGAKLGDEFDHEFKLYRETYDQGLWSEEHFFKQLPSARKKSLTREYPIALAGAIGNDEDLVIRSVLTKKKAKGRLTEKMLTGKLILPMMRKKPLSADDESRQMLGTGLREQERRSIVYVLDRLANEIFLFDEADEGARVRAERFANQAVLAWFSGLVTSLVKWWATKLGLPQPVLDIVEGKHADTLRGVVDDLVKAVAGMDLWQISEDEIDFKNFHECATKNQDMKKWMDANGYALANLVELN